jgi:hypothetical protein
LARGRGWSGGSPVHFDTAGLLGWLPVPIPFAPLVGLALGALFAWIAAPELARDEGPTPFTPAFVIVAAFAGLLWAPVVGYFVVFHGDWSYLYLVPWRRVPSAVDLGLVILSGAAVIAGFWLAVRPVRTRRLRPIVAMVVAPGGLAVAGVGVAAHRLAVSATYAQFHGQFGVEPIGSSTLGKGVLLMGILLALGLAWTVRSLSAMASEGGS